MASIKAKEIEKNKYEFEFLIEKEAFDAEVNKVYRKNVSKMNVPGFRKGKAPKHVVEKLYGATVFYDEALDNLLPAAYEAALASTKLEAVSRPEIDIVSIDEKGVALKAQVWVKPNVEISAYKGLEVVKEEVVVSDEDVMKEIDATRERNSRMLTVEDRPAQNGDTAVIDFEGFLDGVAFEGGKGEKFPLELGSGSFIPGFEEQLVGKNIGEEFDIDVTFPEDYGAENLAGKAVVFKIKIHELKVKELPELDDEFVKDVSEFNTVDEYKADIKAKITERREKEAESKLENAILDALLANVTVDIPECMIEQEIDGYIRDYEYRLKSQGASLEMYFQYTGMTMEKFRESFKAEAEKQVKIRLALGKIVKLEKIKALKKDIEAEYKKIAEGYNVDIETVKNSIPESGISEDIVLRKAVDLIKENAVITTK
ncbi:MAG: trigger factor [Clostridia bacterium]|nr:trigger factor [Clostridia bacterium]MBO5786293.1 trigger factor [Clostridia bacterium]